MEDWTSIGESAWVEGINKEGSSTPKRSLSREIEGSGVSWKCVTLWRLSREESTKLVVWEYGNILLAWTQSAWVGVYVLKGAAIADRNTYSRRIIARACVCARVCVWEGGGSCFSPFEKELNSSSNKGRGAWQLQG